MSATLNLTGLPTTRTIGGVVAEARVLLSDIEPDTSATPGSSWSGTMVAPGHTLGALVLEVRGLIADVIDVVDGSLRYADADLYLYVSDALSVIRRTRPDLFFNLPSGGVPVYTAANAATPFPITDGFWPAVVSFVAATAEMRDDTWAQAGKGPTLLKEFAAGLPTPPWRYSDAMLYAYASDALVHARRLRPDMFLGYGLRGMVLPAYQPVTDALTLFPLDDRYYPSFVLYVVGMALARNSELKPEVGASLYLTMFDQQLST